MTIILIAISLLFPLLAIVVGFWIQYRKANPPTPSATPVSPTITLDRRKISLPSIKSIWGFLQPIMVVGIILALAGAILHHASREWIWENVTGVWQTQVAGKVLIPYKMDSLGTEVASACLPQGSWLYEGVKSSSRLYQMEKNGKAVTGFFNGNGGTVSQNTAQKMPVKDMRMAGAILVTSSLNTHILPGDIVMTTDCDYIKIKPNIPESWSSRNIVLFDNDPIFLVFSKRH